MRASFGDGAILMESTTATGIVFVVAVAKNRVIGRAGELPWRLPGDLRRFRARTMGRPMLMGRRTWDAIGRALPGRETIVLTRDDAFAPPAGVHRVHSLSGALKCMDERAKAMGVDEAMVVGGADVYAALLPFASEVHLTEVDLVPDGDVLFPIMHERDWQEISRTDYPVGQPDDAACVVRVLRRAQ